MSKDQSPFHTPTDAANPGLAKPALALVIVFVVGLVCVGLILKLGQPVQTTTVEETIAAIAVAEDVAPPTTNGQPEMIPAPRAVPHVPPYVSPDGTSPLPEEDQSEMAPIPPTQLIDQPGYDISPLPPPDGPISWDRAYKYVGHTITVEGEIVDADNTGDICFLNFDTERQDVFYVAMFREAFELLPDPPQDHYRNKTLLITGTVTLHHDRPQIEVHDVNQIEVVE